MFQEWSREERQRLVQDGSVSRELDVGPGHERQPEKVVDETGPDADVRRGVPPVEYVPFDELMAGMETDLLTNAGRVEEEQRGRVLELVPKSVRASGLIERGPTPNAAGLCLVGQPSVDQNVQLPRGSFYLETAEEGSPGCSRAVELAVDLLGIGETRGEGEGFGLVPSRTENEGDFHFLLGPNGQTELLSEAGDGACSEGSVQSSVLA